MLTDLSRHLWQSTIFAVAVGLLTFAFRRNRAQVRYWMWFVASLKFLIPVILLTNLARETLRVIEMCAPTTLHTAARIASPAILTVIGQASGLLFNDNQPPAFAGHHVVSGITTIILGVWLCGFAAIVLLRLRSWLRVRILVRKSRIADVDDLVDIRESRSLSEPSVVGILRPVLLLPEGITERLTPSELDAILAHEVCHVRRHDNLFATLHMIVEAVFWFHPLVWWIGARLLEERERACDEEVLLLGNKPDIYADAILGVCKLYMESPLACVSGVSGANIRRRIEIIMSNCAVLELSRVKKCLLASAAGVALAVPFVIGISNAPAVWAQAPATAGAQFDVASIKPNSSGDSHYGVRLAPGGRVNAINATLRSLITTAYSLPDTKLVGGPAWMDSARFDIDARGQGKNPDEVLAMLRKLLADRFQLAVHLGTKEMPFYALVVAKNGPKLDPPRGIGCLDPTSLVAGAPPPEPDKGSGPIRPCGGFNNMVAGQAYGAKVPMSRFEIFLTRILGKPVVNKTGLDGPYDITLRWDPNEFQPASDLQAAASSLPSIFTAVEEQLGLRLESQKGPVEVLIVDRAELPSPN